MKYGKNMAEMRKGYGLSQNELAKQTGISQQMISHWENNKGIPNIEFCVQLADFYGISLDELIGRDTRRNIVNNIHHNNVVNIKQ